MATKMSAKMTEAYEDIVAQTERAKNASFGEWYCGSEEAYEDKLISRTAKIGERRTRMMLKSAHRRYDLAKQGVVSVCASYSTVKALVNRGLIETIDEYGLAGYAVRLIEA